MHGARVRPRDIAAEIVPRKMEKLRRLLWLRLHNIGVMLPPTRSPLRRSLPTGNLRRGDITTVALSDRLSRVSPSTGASLLLPQRAVATFP